MTTEHLVKLAVTLTPVIGNASPEVLISVPGHELCTRLHGSEKFNLEFVSSTGWLEIQLINKDPMDQHTAVTIDKIEFFEISDPKFIWQGQYCPNYPEPWFSQQIFKPNRTLDNTNYLGWNGTWRLDFGVPVFTWIHQVLNLGWIHQ